jgi:hypothetical protein
MVVLKINVEWISFWSFYSVANLHKHISETGKSRNEKERQSWLLHADISAWARGKIKFNSWMIITMLEY